MQKKIYIRKNQSFLKVLEGLRKKRYLVSETIALINSRKLICDVNKKFVPSNKFEDVI